MYLPIDLALEVRTPSGDMTEPYRVADLPRRMVRHEADKPDTTS